MLVLYGWLLWNRGNLEEAVAVLKSVRKYDREVARYGRVQVVRFPGCSTMQAEMYLGQIAFQAGDIKLAEKHLLKSTRVKPCPHTKTKAFPLGLARDLVKSGRGETVRKFCENVLAKFCPGQKETKVILDSLRNVKDDDSESLV